MDVTSLGFRSDLMLRTLAGAHVQDRGDWLVVRTPDNPGFWWGNFLLLPGPVLPGEARDWEARFVAELPDAAHRAYGVDGTSGDVGDPDELAALGVSSEVSTVLTATSGTIYAWPDPVVTNADCRRLVTDGDWEQALALRIACDDLPDTSDHREFIARKLDETRRLVDTGCGAWFGGFTDGALVSGLGIFGDGMGLARYQTVETHPAHRRRGFARRLLLEAGRYAVTELSAQTLVIVADPGYHAIDLYRSAGFADAERQVQLQRQAY